MRKKKTVTTLMASLLLFQGLFTQDIAAANTNNLQGIQEERQTIQQDLSAQEKKINELYAEIQALNEEVNRLDEQLLEKQSRVEEITYQIDTTIEEISTLQKEIDELNTSIEERFELLKTRAASYQKAGGLVNYIEVLFGSQSFGDFLSRLTAVNQIMDSDASLMEQLEADMKLVEEHRVTTTNKLDQLNEMHVEQENERAQIEKEKKQQEKAQASLKETQQELIAYAGELEAEDSRLQNMEEQVRQEIAAAAKKEREEREKRRLALEKQKQEEAAKIQSKEEKKQDGDLVQVAKVEPKISNSQTESSSTAPKQSKPAPKKTEEKKETNQKSFTMTATAYTADCKGCSGVTSTGIDLKKNPDSKVIAVDPSVIPLGSLVHVEGYGYAVAGDTGGAIKGNKIDVFVPSKKAATNWGVKTVKVTIQ